MLYISFTLTCFVWAVRLYITVPNPSLNDTLTFIGFLVASAIFAVAASISMKSLDFKMAIRKDDSNGNSNR